MPKLKDSLAILQGFLREFETTGMCVPSSKWAAKALSAPVREKEHTKNIIEVGAGTGPVTVQIMNDMTLGDSFTICEINPKLSKVLKENVLAHPRYNELKDRITIFEGPVQNVPEDKKFDVIVCALPFLNFSMELTKEIFDKFERFAAEDATMTWYEYIGLRKINQVIAHPDKKERLEQFEQFVDQIGRSKGIDREKVWLNMPPINVFRTSWGS